MKIKVRENKSDIVFYLDSLTNFNWDTIVILTPYPPIEELEKEIKIDLNEVKETSIFSDDVSNVIAFIKGSHLIKYVDLHKDKRDISRFFDAIKIFSRHNSKFKLTETNEKLEIGQNKCLDDIAGIDKKTET